MKKNTRFILINATILVMLLLISVVSCKHPKAILKDTYKDLFLVGTALNRDQVEGRDTIASNLVVEQFNSITSENDMKWERIHPKPGVYSFAAADSFVNFGEKHGMFIVGHCLVWHSQTPDWVFQDAQGNPASRDTLLKRLQDHISMVVGRYKGRIHGWDVVNEAIADTGGLRNSKWYQIIGEEYIEKAFEFAHQADPSAELYYNDYSLPDAPKRDELIKLIRELESKGVKVDGIGMQGHYSLVYPRISQLDSTIMAFSDLGLNIMITEFDLTVLPSPFERVSADVAMSAEFKKKLNPYPDALPDSMQLVLAKRYADLFKVFIKYGNAITRVTFWGINDKQSWRNYWPIMGRTDYPLLFDRNYQPKAAFYSVVKAVDEK